MPVYADDYIEYWARIYRGRRLLCKGIKFENFLQYPQHILSAIQAIENGEFQPLLVSQAMIQGRLDEQGWSAHERREDMKLRMRGDQLIEPLHHKTHPKRKRGFVPKLPKAVLI